MIATIRLGIADDGAPVPPSDVDLVQYVNWRLEDQGDGTQRWVGERLLGA